MKVSKLFAIFAGLMFALAVFLPSARADAWNQATELSFRQPLEVPGQIYLTLVTVPSYRQHATSETQLRFAERPHQRPEALLK